MGDLVTVGITSDLKTPRGCLFTGASADTRTTIGTFAGFYRVIDGGPHLLDIGAGMRVDGINTTLRLNPGRLNGSVRSRANGHFRKMLTCSGPLTCKIPTVHRGRLP